MAMQINFLNDKQVAAFRNRHIFQVLYSSFTNCCRNLPFENASYLGWLRRKKGRAEQASLSLLKRWAWGGKG